MFPNPVRTVEVHPRGARGVIATLLCAILTAGCGDGSASGPGAVPEAPTASAIELIPSDALLRAVSETVQFQLTVRDREGRALSVEGVSWRSLNPAVASVTQGGRVTAEGAGSTQIEVSLGDLKRRATIVVEQTIADVRVSPSGAVMEALGSEVTFEAIAVDELGSPLVPQPFLVWQSSDPTVASVSPGGRVVANGPGSASLLVYVGGRTREVVVAVEQVPVELRLARSSATLWWIGAELQLSASAHDANGYALVSGPQIEWTTLAPEIVTVHGNGRLRAVAPGTGLVRAQLGETVQNIVVTVHQPLAALEVEAPSATIDALGVELGLTATAYDGAGEVLVGTPPVVWTSSDPEVASVSELGIVTSESPGDVKIRAEMEGFSDAVDLTVRQLPVEVLVSPSSTVLDAVGDGVTMTAAVLDGNGVELLTPPAVTWSSSNEGVAGVDQTGRVTAAGPGETQIRATTSGALIGEGIVRVELPDGPGGGEPPPPPPPPPGPQQVFTPDGIDATGATDVTDELLAFFASVPDSSIVRFPAGAQYRVEGTILLEDRWGLTIDGNGGRIFANTDGSGVVPLGPLAPHWPRKRGQLYFHRGGGIVVRNLTIRGGHPDAGTHESAYVASFEAQHGIELIGVNGAEIHDVVITDVYGDLVYLGGRARGVSIQDNHMERNGRQGIGISSADGVVIRDNYIGDTRRATIDLEPNIVSDSVVNVSIHDNTIGPGRLLFIAAGSSRGAVGHVEVARNLLSGRTMTVYMVSETLGARFQISFVDNVSEHQFGSPAALMRFRGVTGLIVERNTAPMQPGRNMVGVNARDSCAVTIRSNNFPAAAAEFELFDVADVCAAG